MKSRKIISEYGFFSALIATYQPGILKIWFMILIPGVMAAQNPGYPYKQYDDRFEGIKEKKELVGGERVILLSASIDNIEFSNAEPQLYNLAFFLNDSAEVALEVWEHKKSYAMKPFIKTYPPGPALFSWPADIANFYHIDSKNLSPLARTLGTGQSIIVPVLLYSNSNATRGDGYTFCFRFEMAVDSVRAKIFQNITLELMHSKNHQYIDKNQMLCIKWNGKNLEKELAEDGLYTLVLMTYPRPRLSDPRNKPPVSITRKFQFYHYLNQQRK